jgi:hypothetical protein
MDERLVATVRERAGGVCEYCRLPESHHPESFEIEHVVPRKHGGGTVLGNLAYACLRCNRHKGPNLAGIDRVTSRTKLVRLFDPRRHKWNWHFRRDGPYLIGQTPIGRVTVLVLVMNDPVRVTLRQQLINEGLFP